MVIYWSRDQAYRFEIIDLTGKFYIFPDPFCHLTTAKTKAFLLIEEAIKEMNRRNIND
ncbi:MAG: hypothetical protein AAGA16_21585 [Cyanobacteria bacterium P01_E01_bin.35]